MELKLIVAGGRDFNNYPLLDKTLNYLAFHFYVNEQISIVSGTARGADSLALIFAKANDVKTYEFPANWNQHGKSAGFIRNAEMAQFADALVAFWDGQSRGTNHMIEYMQKLSKPVHIINY